MSFSLTFQSILDKNIRHIYSGSPSQLAYRHSSEYPNMDQLRQKQENQYLKDCVLRVSEYRSDYKCFIPRAPAFRILSRHEVDAIVDRLSSPTVASRGYSNTSDDETLSEQRTQYPKYQGLKKVSKDEMDEIIERVSKSTKTSEIRDVKSTSLPRVEA